MAKKSVKYCPPEELLEPLLPELRELANQLRALLRELVPEIEEAGYAGWRLIGYRHGRYMGFIAPLPSEIRLGFEHGATLPDPKGLLEGNTKQVKHVVFRTAKDLQRDGLRELIEIAAYRAKFD